MPAQQTRDVIVGIDAGTSLIKTVAFTREGGQLGSFCLPNVYRTSAGDRVEQDMSRTWDDAATALRCLTASVPDLPARVAAIAVTGQGDGTWLIDDDGRPVGPALLWLDSRAARLVEEIRASPQNAALYRRTGSGLNACQQGPQLVWLQANAPECVSRACCSVQRRNEPSSHFLMLRCKQRKRARIGPPRPAAGVTPAPAEVLSAICALSTGADHDEHRTSLARNDHCQMPLDERHRTKPGHVRKHLGPSWRHHADFAVRDALRRSDP
jgi:hypothetical protein